eukprot:TRINITY_DN2934_c0_g2_i2.p1 TRINITY_DN2934_c0_g2~~TRINITY_DN2934_c0_g2_i2.p1  ORF type:complete len:1014 (-),score=148.93 TRINITY_DN2934_c0_g2_i2:902-3781(-)
MRRTSAVERREVTWLHGRPKLSGRAKVLSVEPSLLEVEWLAIGMDSAPRQPPSIHIGLNQVTKIMDYSIFHHWELGDYGYFIGDTTEADKKLEDDSPEEGQDENSPQDPKQVPTNNSSSKTKKGTVRVNKNKRNRISQGFGRGLRKTQANPQELIPSRDNQVVQITCTRQFVDILWQDGTVTSKVPATDLIFPEHINEQDLFPGDFIQEKLDQGDEPNLEKKLGVIQALNASACTAKVQWLIRPQHDSNQISMQNEEVSVYEIQTHWEYEFNFGDIVSNIAAPAQTDILEKIGQVVGTENGKVKINFANGQKGTMFPDEIVVLSPEEGYDIDDDDDDEVGDYSDDGSSWATDNDQNDNCGHEAQEVDSEQIDGKIGVEASVQTDLVPLKVQTSNGAMQDVPEEYIDSIVQSLQASFEQHLRCKQEEHNQTMLMEHLRSWIRDVAQEVCNRVQAKKCSTNGFRDGVVMIKTKIEFGNSSVQKVLASFIQKQREQLMQSFSQFSCQIIQLMNDNSPPSVNVQTGTSTITTRSNNWWSMRRNTNNNSNPNGPAQDQRKVNAFRNAFNWFCKRQRQTQLSLEECSQQTPDLQVDVDQPSTSGQSSARDYNPLPTPTSSQSQSHNDIQNLIECNIGQVELITDVSVSLSEQQTSDEVGDQTLQKSGLHQIGNSSEIFSQFDIVDTCPTDHHFLSNKSVGQLNDNRARMKRIQREWTMLQEGLPSTIWVRTYEDRTDLFRAAIAGADDTPYHDGLYFFDVVLTPEFPSVPPRIHYVSYGMKPNPNLYETGHVCLSLVNTWDGEFEERWNPDTSSLLQLFVSIQGLVLVSKPFFNEAGFDRFIGQPQSEQNAKLYNEQTFIINCKTMSNQLRNPPKGFETLVRDHFRSRGERVLKGIDHYMQPESSVEYTSGLVLAANKDVPEGLRVDWTPSLGFRKLLEKLKPRMQEMFAQNMRDESSQDEKLEI